MSFARPALLFFLAFCLAGCASHPPVSSALPTPNPCAQVAVYTVAYTPHMFAPGATAPGRLNSQQVAMNGNPSLHDLGSQGPLASTHSFSVHYSLQGATLAGTSCDSSAVFWSLDCQDGSSRYADLWAHSDPCVWDEGIL